MKIHYYEIETPEGVLRLDHGYPTEISLEGRLLSKKRKIIPPEIHEFEVDGARFKVTFSWAPNPFKNLGVKCLVERNGELIADNPKQAGVYPRGLTRLILFGALVGLAIGVLIGLGGILYTHFNW